MLADVLAGDLVERLAVQPRRQHRDTLLKAWIGARYLLTGFGPAEVKPQRLGPERAGKAAGQSVGRSPVEIARVLVPPDRAFGEHDQQRFRRPLGNPKIDLALAPFRLRRAGGGEKDEKPGLGEGGLDRLGQVVGGGEAGAVAKDADRAQLPPRLGEAVECRLQRGRELAVGTVGIGDESVVGQPATRRKCSAVCSRKIASATGLSRSIAAFSCRSPKEKGPGLCPGLAVSSVRGPVRSPCRRHPASAAPAAASSAPRRPSPRW